MSWESQGIGLLGALLGASLVRPFGLATAAWLILRVLRVRHPASRHAVWTAVLIGMMALPFVSLIGPHWNVPALPRKHDAGAQAIASEAAFTGFELPTVETGRRPAGVTPESRRRQARRPVLQVYLAGLVAMVTYRMVGSVLLWRVVSRSKPLRARLRESSYVLTPVAVGVLRPVVILPAGWRTWSATTRRAVLAHEFAHLRRHDTLISAVARLVTCVFWFHPLTWWLSRKISDLAELACDAAVLERVDDPAGYSRILLEFADAVSRTGRRVSLPGLTMAAGSGMGRRIDRVFELSSDLSAGSLRKLSRPGVLLALMGLPVLCLAATVGFGESGASSPRSSAAPVQAQSPPAIDPAPVTPSMAAQAVAQPKPAATPKFVVTSVKPSAACGDGGGRGGDVGGLNWSPGRLSLECSTVMGLVRMAYVRFADGRRQTFSMTAPPEPNEPIEGGPSWINSSRYDIDATAEGAPSRETMSGPMMRSLLEDRFQLKIHREIRTIPIYELTVAKGGPKLQAAQPGKCVPFVFGKDPPPLPSAGPPIIPRCGSFRERSANGGADTYGQTMAGLCWQFSSWLDRAVIDKTGVAGAFDIHLELSAADLARDDDAPTDPAAPAIPADPFGAISAAVQKLGLKLSPAKGPGAFLIIDRVERPSEN